MRGKAQSHGVKNAINRIIPAYAGKRRLEKSPVRVAEDHPRTRGEKVFASISMRVAQGSPPHMQGKVSSPLLYHSQGRITPAHAGKRRWPGIPTPLRRDHPRTCGEKDDLFTMLMQRQGSPPHLRGKVALVDGVVTAGRITPALAGKSAR